MYLLRILTENTVLYSHQDFPGFPFYNFAAVSSLSGKYCCVWYFSRRVFRWWDTQLSFGDDSGWLPTILPLKSKTFYLLSCLFSKTVMNASPWVTSLRPHRASSKVSFRCTAKQVLTKIFMVPYFWLTRECAKTWGSEQHKMKSVKWLNCGVPGCLSP